MKLMKTSLVCLMMISTANCATGDECSWAKQITVSGHDTLVRSTKQQIVAHNRKVAAFCR